MEKVKASDVPGLGAKKEIKTQKIELKNVLDIKNRTKEDITIELIPFDEYNDEHVDFAFEFLDLHKGMPSPFSSMTDVAQRYIELFMCKKEEDIDNTESYYNKVRSDKRAARTAFNESDINLALVNFFATA